MMNEGTLIIGINLGDFGSTGSMMINSLDFGSKKLGFDYFIMTPTFSQKAPCIPFGEGKIPFIERVITRFPIRWQWLRDGDFYRSRSKKIILAINKYRSEGRRIAVHLHNIHHARLDVNYLLKRLAKLDIPILYTLHDCWSFTGGCYHYEQSGCMGYQAGCKHCPKGFKFSHWRFLRKTRPLLKSQNIVLLPCSEWLSRQLDKSALSSLPRKVINGETSMTPVLFDKGFRASLNIPSGGKVLVSVNKGFDYLCKLAEILPDDYYLIVLGGTEKPCNSHMLCLGHIEHNEYAKCLSIADCFVSTTPEDTLPLALMEAQLSGLPVVGFGHGGTPELVTEKTGIMVGTDDDIGKLLDAIIYVVEKRPFRKEDILANGAKYKKYAYANRMLPIYKSALSLADSKGKL